MIDLPKVKLNDGDLLAAGQIYRKLKKLAPQPSSEGNMKMELTCTATFVNGVTIIMERITTISRPKRTHRVQSPALSVFFGVGRGATAARVALVPLAAVVVGTSLLTVAATASAVFGWFVSWISSVVSLDLCRPPHINVRTFVTKLWLLVGSEMLASQRSVRQGGPG